MSDVDSQKKSGKPSSIMELANIDPFEFYESLRQQGSPIWDETANAWVVLDYDQCVKAGGSENVFGNFYSKPDPLVAKIKGGEQNITFSQGEDHVRLRRLFRAFLSPSAIDDYRQSSITPVIDKILGSVVPRGRADLMGEVTAQIVPRIMFSVLGIIDDTEEAQEARAKRVLELNNAIFALVANNYKGDALREDALAASEELNNMLLPFIRARRDDPRDDLISRIWSEAPEVYGEMTEENAVAICRELYFAGTDTTVHGSATVLYLVLTNDDIREAVTSDPDTALPHLVEEAMRLYSVVQLRHRIARQDVELGGKLIKKDQLMLLIYAAANRDPAHYGCPASVDLKRTSAMDHLAFGRGVRSCVGANLARAEMETIVRSVLERMPGLRLDPDAESPGFRGSFFRSFNPLNAVWDTGG